MVYVGVGKDDAVDDGGIKGQDPVFFAGLFTAPLEHAAVEEDPV